MNDFKAHADILDINKINGLIDAGLSITNCMLVMEKELNIAVDDLVPYPETVMKHISIYDSLDLTEYLKANGKGFGKPDPIETIQEELTYNNSKIYVWRECGKIVASVTCWDIDEETVATENIFTIPKYRNRHLASSTLQYVLDEATKRGMKRARLTVYADDTEALHMYYKFGFKVTKTLHEFTYIEE